MKAAPRDHHQAYPSVCSHGAGPGLTDPAARGYSMTP